tara:strand:+ start:388 stop:618 length:231 start_codon:yes stop_codon:yes gene_type:complete
MKTDNSTGKSTEFYELGKKMFDRIKPLEGAEKYVALSKWVGLTEEEVEQFHHWKNCTWSTNELVRYVESKLKEKNT